MPSAPGSALLVALLSVSCMDQERAQEQAQHQAEQIARDAADRVTEHATPALDKGKQVVAGAKGWFEDVPGTGELSESSRGWLEVAAEAGDGVVPLVAKGTQLAPVALEIGRVVNDAVDKDYAIEPVYQELSDAAAQAELDEKLSRMPKTQEIDGVRVGFKRLTETSSERKIDESAYLVLWRRDAHLIGFIYRTRSEIDLDKLATETPRLIGLVNQALEKNG